MLSPPVSICRRSVEELCLMEIPPSTFTKGLPSSGKIIYCVLTWSRETPEFWELEKELLLFEFFFFFYVPQEDVTVVYNL